MATTYCGRGRMSPRAAIAKHASKARQGKSKFIVELDDGGDGGGLPTERASLIAPMRASFEKLFTHYLVFRKGHRHRHMGARAAPRRARPR